MLIKRSKPAATRTTRVLDRTDVDGVVGSLSNEKSSNEYYFTIVLIKTIVLLYFRNKEVY